jgi:cytochrome P450
MEYKRGLGLIKPLNELATNEDKLNPFGWFVKMIEEEPIRYDESRGCWDVFDYSTTQKCLKDYKVFSSDRPEPVLVSSIIRMDPPKHRDIKNIISSVFTKKFIEELYTDIDAIAKNLIDDIKKKEEVDIIKEFSYPLAITVIANMLGVPPEDKNKFKKWTDSIAKSAEDNSPGALKKAIAEKEETRQELNNYFKQLIDIKKESPKNDLITKLVTASDEEGLLNEKEILDFCHLLLIAGNETTTNAIANTVRVLEERKELIDELSENPKLIYNLIDESLRYAPPVLNTSRYATEDVDLNGFKVKKGEQVVFWVGSANRDKQIFENPNTFDIYRENSNKHLTFGYGIHYCLGAHLGKLEIYLGIKHLLTHYSEFNIKNKQNLLSYPSCNIFGVQQLILSSEGTH